DGDDVVPGARFQPWTTFRPRGQESDDAPAIPARASLAGWRVPLSSLILRQHASPGRTQQIAQEHVARLLAAQLDVTPRALHHRVRGLCVQRSIVGVHATMLTRARAGAHTP